MPTNISCPWINLGKTTVHALRSGQLLLAAGCTPLAVDLLAGLQVQVGLCGGCHSLAELLAMFCCQVGLLAGLLNHLWLGRITGCVSWHFSVTGWTLHLGGAIGRALN